MPRPIRITSLPSRYEPLVRAFGDSAKATFIPSDDDLKVLKRLLARAESAGQGKILFLAAPSGSGKSTFVHSAEIFLPDEVARVVRLDPPHELPIERIPTFLSSLPAGPKFTIVNFDYREAPSFDEAEYRGFLVQLNGILRQRRDLIIVWPVTDHGFAERLVSLLSSVGGQSPFGNEKIHRLNGLRPSQFKLVLEKILHVASWRLEDAAISTTEIDSILSSVTTIGQFLDQVQDLIAQRFDVEPLGIKFPRLVIVVSSGDSNIRETCRALRRADSFYLEASRLLMYTKKSNVAEWWQNRAEDLRSALPHVIALFDAQLVSLSAASVVHSVLLHGSDDLKSVVTGVQSNRGAAVKVISSSELFKFIQGDTVDSRGGGSEAKDETVEAFHRLQAMSETHHQKLNRAVIQTIQNAGAQFDGAEFDKEIRPGLIADVVIGPDTALVLEFHHKHAAESLHNKISIYILEKLKEYAINYGLAKR